MSNTETQTRIETRRRRGCVIRTRLTIKRTPATLSESRMVRSPWFHHAGNLVTEVNKVEVEAQVIDENGNPDRLYPTPTKETLLEVVTPYGRGCIIKLQDRKSHHGYWEDLQVVILNDGRCLSTGLWTKRGNRVGWCMNYLRAMGYNPNNRKKVESSCPLRLFHGLAGNGKAWHDLAA